MHVTSCGSLMQVRHGDEIVATTDGYIPHVEIMGELV
jgi:hypothetical protein